MSFTDSDFLRKSSTTKDNILERFLAVWESVLVRSVVSV